MQEVLFAVIYDSITNSVFESQVVLPLLRATDSTNKKLVIISFEKEKLTARCVEYFTKKYPKITFKIFRRLPYGGLWTLWLAIFQLKKFLKRYKYYTLRARGPHAGFVCLKARSAACNKLIIQVRGLVADEYKYAHSAYYTGIKKFWCLLREKQLRTLEKAVYTKLEDEKAVLFEVVSRALKEHLIKVFGCVPETVVFAHDDIPAVVELEQRIRWRQETRQKLTITENAVVYCYNGSAKPWQCPEMTVNFFKQKYTENNTAILLVLTQDSGYFSRLVEKYNLPTKSYRILTVNPTEIYTYLAAADAGMLFREQNIINWVSRPTKLLEYQAVGLPIIHNNTIEVIAQY